MRTESPDSRGTRDYTWINPPKYSWGVWKKILSGDRKVSYWATPAILEQVKKARDYAFLEKLPRFIQVRVDLNEKIQLSDGLNWEDPANHPLQGVTLSNAEIERILLEMGAPPVGNPGNWAKELIVWWPTSGALGRGEPPYVYFPHATMCGEVFGETYGGPNISNPEGEVVPAAPLFCWPEPSS